MSVDLSQFHSVFFEESYEAVNSIESGLLDMDVDAVDPEVVNTIFRAAHSIKGGSATFGFSQVAAYTHVMENLLDEVREGSRPLSQDIIDVLLGSVDTLRVLLAAAQADEPLAEEEFALHKAPLDAIMSGEPAQVSPAAPPQQTSDPEPAPSVVQEPVQSGWRIVLTPHPNMMQTGNDPLRLLREVAELGPVEVLCDTDQLPEWQNFEPLNCYLSWTILLHAPVEIAAIEEIFAWVEDECDLALVPMVADADPALASPTTVAEEEAVVASEQDAAVATPETKAVAPASAAPAPKASPAKSRATPAESQSIRVDLDKIDALINMLGELVITQSMLNMLSGDEALQGLEKLQNGLTQLHRQTRDLQEGVMQMRMLPISFCFSRFPRLVRDLGRQLEKQIDLQLSGESTEVDKTVIEKITDPLVHLVRNSIDHGIELPAEREAKEKPPQGTVWLRAYHQVGNIVIEIEDDGKGLDAKGLISKARAKGLISEDEQLSDQEAFELIFAPGFSTKEEASDLSGRGVGMDVVKRNVQSLGGSITLESALGAGTKFTIRLPLTLAIMDGQLVHVGDEVYVIPLVSIVESLQPDADMINIVAGNHETIRLRGEYVPVLRLAEILNTPAPRDDLRAQQSAESDSEKQSAHNEGVRTRQWQTQSPLVEGIVVIVEHENRRIGLFVNDLSSQQQIVIKSLEDNYRTVAGVSGATILGDGQVALILDVGGLVQLQQASEEGFADAG